MSIDTDSLRHDADQACLGKFLVDIRNACDEIDRLRDALDRSGRILSERTQELAKEIQAQSDTKNELATLREQLRPRSIKEEPVTKLDPILCFTPAKPGWDVVTFSTDYKPGVHPTYTHWLPMPPAPTKPDKFEEWVQDKQQDSTYINVRGGCLTKSTAAAIWDACKKAYNISD